MNRTIHLACAADEKYLPHTAAMVHSVLTATPDADITVHFTHFPDFPPEKLATFAAFVKESGGQFDALCVDYEALSDLPSTTTLPSVVWQRALLPRLLPDIDKILYLDGDVIALHSVEPLWDVDLSDYYVAAVTNPMHDEMADWPTTIGLPDSASYFNSGVLLMNLALMREHDCAEKIVRRARERPDLVHWGDQCPMNAVLHARRYPLHPKWNVMNSLITFRQGRELFSGTMLAEAEDDPQIVHFEGFVQSKPWHYRSEHPHQASYLMHRQQTPWPLTSFEGRTPVAFVKKHILPPRLLALLRQLRQRFLRGIRR